MGLAAVAILTANIALQVGVTAVIVSGPTLQALFGVSKMELGIILGAANVGIVIISPLAGYACRRWGVYSIFLLGLLLGLLSSGLLVTAGSFPGFLVGMITLGLSSAYIGPTSWTLLSDLFDTQVKRIMYLASATWLGCSALAAPLIGRWLELTLERDWGAWSIRSVFVSDLLLLIACAGFSFWTFIPAVRNDERLPELDTGPAQMSPLSTRWHLIPVLGICHGLMLFSVLGWISPMVQQKFGVSGFKGALLIGVVYFGLATGRLILAIWDLNLDERIILTISGLLGGLLLTLALLSPSYALTFILTGAGSLVCCATYPCILSLVSTHFPQTKATLYGYTEASVALAAFFAPIVVAVLAEYGLPLWLALTTSPLSAFVLGTVSFWWKIKNPLDSTSLAKV